MYVEYLGRAQGTVRMEAQVPRYLYLLRCAGARVGGSRHRYQSGAEQSQVD